MSRTDVKLLYAWAFTSKENAHARLWDSAQLLIMFIPKDRIRPQPFLYSFYHSLSSLRAESYSLPYAWIRRNRTTFHPCTMYSQELLAWSTDLPVFFDLGACVISSGNLFRVRPYGRALLIRHFFKLGTKERTSMVGCFTTVRVYELLT